MRQKNQHKKQRYKKSYSFLCWMKKGVIIGFVFVVFLFLLGCSFLEKEPEEVVVPDNASVPVSEPVPEVPSVCSEGWTCVSNRTRAFQHVDCTTVSSQECKLGCINGTCATKVCTLGFKCMTSVTRGYQQGDCSWISKQKCEFGCKNGNCTTEEEQQAVDAVAAAATPAPQPQAASPAPQLKVGESVNVSVGENQTYQLRIYILDRERVKFQLGDLKSDWLTPGQSFRFAYGTTVELVDIYFQTHEGGLKAAEYRVS